MKYQEACALSFLVVTHMPMKFEVTNHVQIDSIATVIALLPNVHNGCICTN